MDTLSAFAGFTVFISFLQGWVQCSTCSQNLLGRLGHGVIASYNYPFDYSGNGHCSQINYTIHLQQDLQRTQYVCFTFHRFDLALDVAFLRFGGHCGYQERNRVPLSARSDTTNCVSYTGYGYKPVGSRQDTIWSDPFCWKSIGGHGVTIIFESYASLAFTGFLATFEVVNSSRIDRNVYGYAPCYGDQFVCFSDRRCVDREKRCSTGPANCEDESDGSYAHARCSSWRTPDQKPGQYACDFDNSVCGITGGYWTRRSRTNDPCYGPSTDHTNSPSDYGNYFAMDFMRVAMDISSSSFAIRTEIPLSSETKEYCLSFWYHMSGRDVGRLSVAWGIPRERPVWSREGDLGNEWHHGLVSATTGGQNNLDLSTVIFTAVKRSERRSQFSLDDISILGGACSSYDDISCNFEVDLCGWDPGRTTATIDFAYPDHSPSGRGMALRMYGSSISVVSPPVGQLMTERHSCLTFWYRTLDGVKLYVETLDANSRVRRVFNDTKKTLYEWCLVEITLSMAYGSAFQVRVRAEALFGSSTSMDLDNINFVHTDCGPKSCDCSSGNGFRCRNGNCILDIWHCNDKNDCGDNSDEIGCDNEGSKSGASVQPVAVVAMVTAIVLLVVIVVTRVTVCVYRKRAERRQRPRLTSRGRCHSIESIEVYASSIEPPSYEECVNLGFIAGTVNGVENESLTMDDPTDTVDRPPDYERVISGEFLIITGPVTSTVERMRAAMLAGREMNYAHAQQNESDEALLRETQIISQTSSARGPEDGSISEIEGVTRSDPCGETDRYGTIKPQSPAENTTLVESAKPTETTEPAERAGNPIGAADLPVTGRSETVSEARPQNPSMAVVFNNIDHSFA